jgi:uncharacterized protein YbcI
MITLYQCTIFVSLTLLAIVIAIFVFAVSIYRAVSELSAKEEEGALNRRKEIIKETREPLIKKIRGVKDEHLTKVLGVELDKLNTELNTIDQSILKSRDKVKKLTLRNMVAIPASLLLMSIITAGVAIVTSGIIQTIIGITSLALIAVSLYFIYKNLSVVEFFSKLIDLGILMEQALDRHRMKSTPVVQMELPDFQLEIPRGETKEIMYFVSLKQGTIARNARVRFSGTEELEFPDEKIEQLGIDYDNMRNPKEFWHGFQDVNPKVHKRGKFVVKAPGKPGKYTMAYWLQCDEYAEDQVTFKIKVI